MTKSAPSETAQQNGSAQAASTAFQLIQTAARNNGREITQQAFITNISPSIKAIAERFQIECFHEHIHASQVSEKAARTALNRLVKNLALNRRLLREISQPDFRDWLMAIGRAYEDISDIDEIIHAENEYLLATNSDDTDTPAFVRGIDIFDRDLAATCKVSGQLLSRIENALSLLPKNIDQTLTTPAFRAFANSLSGLWAVHTGKKPTFSTISELCKRPETGKSGAFVSFVVSVCDEYNLPLPRKKLGYSLCNEIEKSPSTKYPLKHRIKLRSKKHPAR
jgi:hypothetical protein